MSFTRLTALLVCLMAPAVALAADAELSLYLQPLPAEAARLTFELSSVTAVTTTGTEHPLRLGLKAIGQAEAGRQRLLASGRIPAGSYTGFTFNVRHAALKGQQGEVSLLVPDTPVRLNVPFSVDGRGAPLLWLTLSYQDSISSGVSFSPVFSVVTPGDPIAGYAGFVSNSGSNTITVFDKQLGQAVSVIDTCAGPAGMALDQRRRRLYVACSRDDEIQAIDVTSADVVERTRLFPGDGPRDVALTPDGTTLVSVNTGSNSVSFFDAVSLTRLERLDVGSGPASLLIDAGGRRAFVFNTLSSSISIIDMATRTLVATIATDAAPVRGALNARGDRLYVLHERSPYMTVLDPRQLSVVTRARLRVGVGAIAVDNVRNQVCIGGRNDTTIEFYDPIALVPVNSMRTRAGVAYLAIDQEANRLHMVSPDTRSLVIGSLADRKIVAQIDVGSDPYEVAVMGEK